MKAPVHELTADVLDWIPYVPPVVLAEATPEQLAAMKITPGNTKISDYVLTLAHDPESLEARSPLFNLIMMGREGLSRAERELGALAASIVNRCIYCASVHARHFVTFGKDQAALDEIFARGVDAQLAPREAAIFDFSVKLSATPPTATADDIRRLKEVGLDDLEIHDLIHAVALFGWANRLMHTLGYPTARS